MLTGLLSLNDLRGHFMSHLSVGMGGVANYIPGTVVTLSSFFLQH